MQIKSEIINEKILQQCHTEQNRNEQLPVVIERPPTHRSATIDSLTVH